MIGTPVGAGRRVAQPSLYAGGCASAGQVWHQRPDSAAAGVAANSDEHHDGADWAGSSDCLGVTTSVQPVVVTVRRTRVPTMPTVA